MHDSKYCYPNSDVLINKLGIMDAKELFETEKELTLLRVRELENRSLKGKFDFKHLKTIHRYIFQDIYDWAGKERTVEIGKGNLFCTTACIHSYAQSVFEKYYPQCFEAKDDFEDFVRALANNYGDLNALHPFREGNGRAQREFARELCLKCGYDFNLQKTTHKEMLEASVLSFEKGDNSGFVRIFSEAVIPHGMNIVVDSGSLGILTSDDMSIGVSEGYDYYDYDEYENADLYNELYKAKIDKMEAEKGISDAKAALKNGRSVLAGELEKKAKKRTRNSEMEI